MGNGQHCLSVAPLNTNSRWQQLVIPKDTDRHISFQRFSDHKFDSYLFDASSGGACLQVFIYVTSLQPYSADQKYKSLFLKAYEFAMKMFPRLEHSADCVQSIYGF